MAGARSSGGRRGGGGGGGWTPSPAFLEQPLEREITPFFLQMTARVYEGVPSPLIEPIMGQGRKGPLEAHNLTPKNTHKKIKVHKEKWLYEWGPEKGRTHPKA